MPNRLIPIFWKQKEKIYEGLGYKFFKQDGTHRSYIIKELSSLTPEEIEKLPIDINNPNRPPIIILTQDSEIPIGTLNFNKKKLRLSRKEFIDWIEKTK